MFTPDKYSEEEYPLFKYFWLTKYSDENKLKENLKNNYKYPLLNKLLSIDSKKIEKLKYLSHINDFSNYMIEKYSSLFLRSEAEQRDLDDDDKKKLIKTEFINSWENIKTDAIYYEKNELKPIKLSEKNKLIYFLNDNTETKFGMHIAAAYKSFISWQNEFLKSIIEANKVKDSLLHFYIHNLNSKIHIQNAKENNILTLKEIELESIINQYSKRNIFKEDGTIDYKNYNTFIYDFDSIEKDLAGKILTGKCLFDDKLKFVTFFSEENPEILTQFSEKYKPQNQLSDDAQNKIKQYLKNRFKNEDVLKDFFKSFQKVFFYLNNAQNKLNSNNMNEIINTLPGILKISDEFKKFFEKEGIQFEIDKLMNIFLYIENLCFKETSKNLDKKYRSIIDESIKKNIQNKYKDSKDNKELCKALRKYIFRYLIINKNIENLENNNLNYALCKSDLWDINMGNIDVIKKFISEKLGKFNLKVSESFDLYNLIGVEEQVFNESIFMKKKKKNQKRKRLKTSIMKMVMKGIKIMKDMKEKKEKKKKKKVKKKKKLK